MAILDWSVKEGRGQFWDQMLYLMYDWPLILNEVKLDKKLLFI